MSVPSSKFSEAIVRCSDTPTQNIRTTKKSDLKKVINVFTFY